MDKLLTIAFSAAIILCLPFNSGDFLSGYQSLRNKLPNSSRVDDIIDFVPGEPREHDPLFWAEISGLPGLIILLHESFIYSRIVQLHRKEGYISKEYAREVWMKTLRQAGKTVRAIVEAGAAHLTPNNHNAARAAVEYHCQIVFRANTLCYAKGVPECPIRLPDLL